MSKVAIQGNASGTGTFTIAAPNSNTDRSLTLPDEAGTVLTSASDIESQVKTATNASGSAPIYACRAWVNFDGTGTVSIREDGNVSSITDNGTGDYTVNFTTAMPDSNYCVVCPSTNSGGNRGGAFYGPKASGEASPDPQGSLTTSNVRVMSSRGSDATSNGNAVDSDGFYIAIFR